MPYMKLGLIGGILFGVFALGFEFLLPTRGHPDKGVLMFLVVTMSVFCSVIGRMHGYEKSGQTGVIHTLVIIMLMMVTQGLASLFFRQESRLPSLEAYLFHAGVAFTTCLLIHLYLNKKFGK